MQPHGIDLDSPEMRRFRRRWAITELAVFGSVLRDDFRRDSDVDLLVTFTPDAEWDLLDLLHMQDDAAAILGRPVDLVSRAGLEQSCNAIVRGEVLGTSRAVYAQQ
jgi:predicted nucleotidyltransferase